MSSADVSEVEVKWAGDGYLFHGSDAEGHDVVYDSNVGQRGAGIGPMRGLLTSLGACSGMDIVAILRKRKQNLTSLKISVTGERPGAGYPRPFTKINVRCIVGGRDLRKEYVEEAVRDSMNKFCSVAATVRGKAEITYDYELVRE